MPNTFSKPCHAKAVYDSIFHLNDAMPELIKSYKNMIGQGVLTPDRHLDIFDVVRFNPETGRGETCMDNMLALHTAIHEFGTEFIPENFHIVFGARLADNPVFDAKLQGNIAKLKKAVSDGHLVLHPDATYSDFIPYGGFHFKEGKIESWAFQGVRSHFTKFAEAMPTAVLFNNVSLQDVYVDKEDLFSEYMIAAFGDEDFNYPESVIQGAKLYAFGVEIFTKKFLKIEGKQMATLIGLGFNIRNVDDNYRFNKETNTVCNKVAMDVNIAEFRGGDLLSFYQELCETFFRIDKHNGPEDIKTMGGAIFLDTDFFKLTKGSENYNGGEGALGALPNPGELSFNSAVAWLVRFWLTTSNNDNMNDFVSVLNIAGSVRIDCTERMFFGKGPDAGWGVGQMPAGLTDKLDGITAKDQPTHISAHYYFGFKLTALTMSEYGPVMNLLGISDECPTILDMTTHPAKNPRNNISIDACLKIPTRIVEKCIAPFYTKLALHFKPQCKEREEEKLVEEEHAELGKRSLSTVIEPMAAEESAAKRGGSGGSQSPLPQRTTSSNSPSPQRTLTEFV